MELGYKVYGGAVKDRERIQAHIVSLEGIIIRIADLRGEALKDMTIEGLYAEEHK